MAKKFSKSRPGRREARPPQAPAPRPAPPAWVRPLWYLAAALTAWSFGFVIARGSDLWWHIAAGRWILGRRALPGTDPWGFTPGRPWLNHEWLSDVLYAGWIRLFGMPSLALWKWGLIIATFGLLFHLLWRRSGSASAAWLAMLLAGLISQPFLDVRPHLYTLLGFVAVLSLTLLPRRPARALPLLFLVWANLHGGVIFGLMTLAVALGAWALWQPDEADLPPRRRWIEAAGIGLASLLATAVNPYGFEVLLQPLRYAAGSSIYVALLNEWQPAFTPGGLHSPLFPWGIAAFGLAAAGLLIGGSPARQRFAERDLTALVGLILGALTLAMALKSRRFIPLFAIAQALPLSLVLSSLLAALRGGREARRGWLAALLPAAALLVGIVRLEPYPLRPGAFHSLTDEDTFPVDSCNFLRANHLTGRIFTDYNWGGFLELCTDGQARVFIDGRADTVFAPETFRQYLQIERQEPGWEAALEATGADFALLSKEKAGGLIAPLLASGRWRQIHEGFVGVLLARADLPLAELRPAPASAWRDLAVGAEQMRAGDLPGAEDALARALQREPDLAAACANLAVVQKARGKTAEALQTARRCQRIFPDPGLMRDLEAPSRDRD
jgi:hypothetical protein